MSKLVETREKVEKEGWDTVGVTDGGGWISPLINSRKKYMLGNPFGEVVFYEGLADVLVDEKSVKQVEKSVAKRKVERKSDEYEFTADIFLEEDCFFSGSASTRERFSADGDTCFRLGEDYVG